MSAAPITVDVHRAAAGDYVAWASQPRSMVHGGTGPTPAAAVLAALVHYVAWAAAA